MLFPEVLKRVSRISRKKNLKLGFELGTSVQCDIQFFIARRGLNLDTDRFLLLNGAHLDNFRMQSPRKGSNSSRILIPYPLSRLY